MMWYKPNKYFVWDIFTWREIVKLLIYQFKPVVLGNKESCRRGKNIISTHSVLIFWNFCHVEIIYTESKQDKESLIVINMRWKIEAIFPVQVEELILESLRFIYKFGL